MATFKVEIIETCSRIIEIESSSEEEAQNKISEMYKEEDIVLDYSDYVDTTIKVV